MSSTPPANRRNGSLVDAGGGSSCTPQEHVQENTSKVEKIGAGDGGAGKPAAPVYNRDGEEHVLDPEVVNAVYNFKVPEGHVRKGARDRSFMYSLGVYVEALEAGEKHKYFCLADAACRSKKKMIPCKGGDRSNVNSHLKNTHGLQGMGGLVKGEKKKATKESTKEHLEPTHSTASSNSGVETDRVYGLLAVRMLVEKCLPFSFFSSGTSWKELVGFITAQTPSPSLPPGRVKHLLLEMYLATKKAVAGNMQEEIKEALLPVIHYGLDLWTCKVSGRKYLRVHVSYVDSKFTLRHALLAAKHYAPSAEIQGTEKASEFLLTIFRAALAEYGIKLSDLAGGTTDNTYDIKAMCLDLKGWHKISWDLCDCHLADKAADNAFGASADPKRCKNQDAREVIKLIIKIAAKANQSTAFQQKFDDPQLEMLNETLLNTRKAPQRWLRVASVMERVICLWHVLGMVFANDSDEFPLGEDNKDDILQLYSLLQPLSAIMRDGQNGVVPMTAEIRLAFAQLKTEVLDPEQPLRVFDIPPAPTCPEAGQEEGARTTWKGDRPKLPSALVPSDKLRPVTVKTRKELSKALVQGLFGPVWDEESAIPSPFRDASVLLTPPFNTGKYLDALRLTAADMEHLVTGKRGLAPTLDEDVATTLDACWADIQARALGAAREQRSRSASRVADGQQSLKRLRPEGSTSSSTKRSRFSAFARGEVGGGTEDDVEGEDKMLGELVAGEIDRYKLLFIKANEMDCRDVLPWWGRTGKNMFPYLAPVAQQVFGNQVAASQVTHDFSGFGNLLVPSRSRVDTYWLEMMMFLKANFEHIPALSQIPIISAKNIRACLPARFHGEDANLMAAEAAFDVLSNTATPGADDIGFEGWI